MRDSGEGHSKYSTGSGIVAAPETYVHGVFPCSELVIRDSLVAGNRIFGIYLDISRATIERTIVRDTCGNGTCDRGGLGIVATAHTTKSQGSELVLRDSLVARSRAVGIGLFGSKATVERSVVRENREQPWDKKFGSGIQATNKSGEDRGSELLLRDCLVTDNRYVGISVLSSKVTVERSVVRDTREQAFNKEGGTGIAAFVHEGKGRESELVLHDSLVTNNRAGGIVVSRSNATVKRSVVRDTRHDGTGQFGDGLVSAGKATLYVTDTTVERNTRAGFLFDNAGGSVHRSLIHSNVFSIDLEDGAAPLISDDNKIVDNQINNVSSGQGLKAAPIPSVPKL